MDEVSAKRDFNCMDAKGMSKGVMCITVATEICGQMLFTVFISTSPI